MQQPFLLLGAEGSTTLPPRSIEPAACFHCGQAIPVNATWGLRVAGEWRPMCCAGCEAVAEAIVANGLDSYYSARRVASPRPPENLAIDPGTLVDDALWQQGKVAAIEDSAGTVSEVLLLIGGMTCPACAWLIEQRVGRMAGVVAASANYATGRMRVRWTHGATQLSRILAAVTGLGYSASVYSKLAGEAQRRGERKRAAWRLFVAGLGMMQVMMYAVPLYLAAPGEMTPANEALMRWAGLALTLPVMLYAAAPFFSGALRDLRARRLGMDVPVAVGIGVAFAASAAALTGARETYFDSVTMFVFFLLGGRYLEMAARDRAARWIDDACSTGSDDRAERLVDYPRSNDTETVALGRLRIGDRVLVRRGAAVPADGVLESAEASVDEAILTGESRPREKRRGDAVLGGSVNIGQAAVVRVARTGALTTRAAIERLVERAMAARPALAQLAARFAGRITLTTLLVALAACLVWWPTDHDKAVHAAIAVLIATCPCALALATPLAVVAATARLAASGVIVASPSALETLGRITRIVLDKTGTLTDGQLELADVLTLRGTSRADALAIAGALETSAHHPVARALRRAREAAAHAEIRATAVEEAGTGVRGWVEDRRLFLGTPEFVGPARTPEEKEAAAASPGHTCAVLADADGWLAVFHFQDRVRREAPQVIGELAAIGLNVTILSGDSAAPVERVAAALGVRDARAGQTPADKRSAIEAMQRAGEVVAMVGDGVNDAPVLAQAHCAISLSSGATLAQSHADLILLGGQPPLDAPAHDPGLVRQDGLRGVPTALETARRMRRIVSQNLCWAFAYNVAAVPLAAFAMLPPWAAGLGMAISSLLVVLNSMRLLPRYRAA